MPGQKFAGEGGAGRHRPLGSEVRSARGGSRPATPRPDSASPWAGAVPTGGGSPAAPAVPRPPQGAPPASCGPGPRPRPRRQASVYLRPGSRRCRLQSLPPPPRCSPTAPGGPPQHTATRAHPGATQTLGERPRYGRWDSALPPGQSLPPEVDFRQRPAQRACHSARPQARHVCQGQARAPGPIFGGPPLFLAPVVLRALPCETGCSAPPPVGSSFLFT